MKDLLQADCPFSSLPTKIPEYFECLATKYGTIAMAKLGNAITGG